VNANFDCLHESLLQQRVSDTTGQRLDEVEWLAFDDGGDLGRYRSIVDGVSQVVRGSRRTCVNSEHDVDDELLPVPTFVIEDAVMACCAQA